MFKKLEGKEYELETLKHYGLKILPTKKPILLTGKLKRYLDTVEEVMEIDYIKILDFLKRNHGVSYKDPSSCVGEEKERILNLKQESQIVKLELEKIFQLCSTRFELTKKEPIYWLNRKKDRIKEYLWLQMKQTLYVDSKISISIFMFPDSYRVSLEIRDDGLTSKEYQQYYRFLDMPKKETLSYLDVSQEIPVLLEETSDQIRRNLQNGVIKKVQLCKIIEKKEQMTNREYGRLIFEAIELLLPYYQYVLKERENMEKTFQKNILFYGPPGTGKTYHTAIYAIAIADSKKINSYSSYEEVMNRYKQLKEMGRIEAVTFHQSYGYEQFIEGIKPNVDNQSLGYTIESGIFQTFAQKASTDTLPYIFIIDEINRGNIAEIFGELITIIEASKRKNQKEEMSILLPYSKKLFCVPDNVYILATMNTANHSIETMDLALRRRFHFIEMLPDETVLTDIKINVDQKVLDISLLLKILNERIEFLYDKEHTLGHAFFTPLKENPTLTQLQRIFRYQIFPLLQEYFYEDEYKIQLVLGDNRKEKSFQFLTTDNIDLDVLFGEDVNEFIELPAKKYIVQEEAFSKMDSYLKIDPRLER